MDKIPEISNKHIFSSKEIIEKVLTSIGIQRERTSTYEDYSYDNGVYLRLRISDHGIFLQHWYDKNREARMNGEDKPKLNIGQNLAITFTLNKEECVERGWKYPHIIRNQTSVKTDNGNNAKPQFSIRHIAYYSDHLSEEEVNSIITAIKSSISDGSIYQNPITDNTKTIEWVDTSNCPPKKIENNKNLKENINMTNQKKQIVRLTESQLHNLIAENIQQILKEESYRDAAKKGDHTSKANKRNLNYKKNVLGQKDAATKFHKFAKKYNLDKTASGARATCNWEDNCDDNGKSVNESYLNEVIKESIKNVLNENTYYRGNLIEFNAFDFDGRTKYIIKFGSNGSFDRLEGYTIDEIAYQFRDLCNEIFSV